MGNTYESAIFDDLRFIYGRETAKQVLPAFMKRLATLQQIAAERGIIPHELDQRDAILITYGDIIRPDDESTPLQGLYTFIHQFIKDSVNTIHLLPFCPYSSDDGFSVIDYREINQELGSWDDVQHIGSEHHLMFDLVANHVSRKSRWFAEFLAGKRPFDGFFHEVDPDEDLSSVFRPRALPLLTQVESSTGSKHVWTTFSDDQIDLNYSNPVVLLEVIDILNEYIGYGADLIRLDAIAFIWKELGTSCIHHPKTHRIIKLIRKMLEGSGSGVRLITETNVPHKENISYFGSGYDEAAMVYNFPLPPLTLHAFMTGDASILSGWAHTLEFPTKETTYFNFLASHDGVGLMPASGILPTEEVSMMAKRIIEHGGFVSYKNNSDDTTSPYEMNMNYFDALAIAGKTAHEVSRFIASQSIMLALRGVPGIYFHSLIGSRNWKKGPEITGMSRSINREKLSFDHIADRLNDPTDEQHQILSQYCHLLGIRKEQKAFSPHAQQIVLQSPDPTLFIVARISEDMKEAVLCITNVADRISSPLKIAELFAEVFSPAVLTPLNTAAIPSEIEPYDVIWIKGTT